MTIDFEAEYKREQEDKAGDSTPNLTLDPENIFPKRIELPKQNEEYFKAEENKKKEDVERLAKKKQEGIEREKVEKFKEDMQKSELLKKHHVVAVDKRMHIMMLILIGIFSIALISFISLSVGGYFKTDVNLSPLFNTTTNNNLQNNISNEYNNQFDLAANLSLNIDKVEIHCENGGCNLSN